MQKLKLGLPDGSLADPKRGCLKELLERARIFVRNYEDGSGKPAEVANIGWLEAIVQRPQELPLLAAQGFCDAFFCGDDWAREWELRGYPSRKFMGLGIGKVQIVAAAKPEKNERRIAASEYPYIARDYMAKLGADAQIIKYGEPVKGGFAVIDSMGKTELKLIYGMADFVVENTQTGSTLKALGLVVKELLFDSECSFYTAKGLADEWKLKKAERIAMMLKGAISAYGTDLVTFNVANSQLEKVLAYVRQNKLFGDEETLVRGERMSELTLQLQTANPAKPLIDIIADLREFGATSIDGVPLSYSVR